MSKCKLSDCRGCDYEFDDKIKEYKELLKSKEFIYSMLAFIVGLALVLIACIITE